MSELSFKNSRSKSKEILKFRCEKYIEKVANLILKQIYNTHIYNHIKKSEFKDDFDIFISKYLFQELKPYISKIFIIKHKKYDFKNQIILVKKKELFFLLKHLYKNKVKFTNVDNNFKNFLNHIRYFINKNLLFNLSKKNRYKNKKIGVSYIEGFDENKKNDLFWYDKKIFKSSEIVIYFQDKYLKFRHDKKFKGEALNYFKKNEIKTVDLSKFQKIYHIEFIYNLKKIIKKNKSENIYEIFFEKILNDFFKKIEFWYSFFSDENINIDITHLEVGTDIIAKKIAINLLNGCSVKKIRSYITENDPRLVGWYNENIIFSWGKDLAKRLQNTKNKPNTIVLSGYYDAKKKPLPPEDQLNQYAKKHKKNILILDNAWSENNQSDVENGNLQLIYKEDYISFYKKIFSHFNGKNYGLIIKPKKYELIKKCKELNEFTTNLEKDGRCYVIKDAFQYPLDNILNVSNDIISIGIFFPTVLLESIIKKKEINTYYFDYSNLKVKEKEIYKYLINKVLFNSLEELLNKMDFNLNQNRSNFSIWEKIIENINTYKDEKGNHRIANYIRSLSLNLEKYEIKDAIKFTNDYYKQKWGKDKLILLK